MGSSNFDGKGSYLVFNVGDAIFISDLNSQDKVICYFIIWLFKVLENLGCLMKIKSLNVGSDKVYPFQ